MSPALRRLWALHRPWLGRLWLATGLMVVTGLIPPTLVFLVERVLDRALIAQDRRALMTLPLAIVGLYLLNGLLGVSRTLLTRGVAFRVVAELRRQLFEHLLRLEPGWHQRHPLGQRLSWLSQDVGQVQYLVSAWCTLVEKPLTLIGLIAAAFWMDARLAGIALVVLPLVVVPISWFGKRLREAARRRLSSLEELTSKAQQALSGLREVQAFRAESRQAEHFERANQAQRRETMRAVFAQRAPGPVVEVVASVAVAAVLALGGQRVFEGELEPGQLIAFLVAMGLVNQPLKSLSEVVSLTHRALAGAERVFQVLDTQPTIREGSEALDARELSIELDQICVDYGQGEVLHRVSLRLEPGEQVALVGASGAGKSTLLSLIPRFVLPSSGSLLIGDRPASDYTLDSLRAHIAVVTQDAWLMHGTVLDNVRLGRPDASLDQVRQACREAFALDFVEAMPAGFQTVVEEGGQRLSGGQRQRICIARALLMDAPILLLDEATSALDRESEQLVQAALDRLRAGRTVLSVAHRASTVQAADRVIVLKKGRLAEDGTHAELLAAGGEYARLYGEIGGVG